MNLLLDPREFRLLDGLRLNPRKYFQGRVRGERLTKKKGISIEFADYREYTEGDDLRHLDWNVLARLDTPVMRTYQDEEDLALHLLLDVSPSMEFGDPPKLDTAKQLGAAIAYVALNGGDAVFPRALGLRQQTPRPLRGRVGYPRLATWAENLKPPEQTAETLSKALKAFAASSARAGIVLILSDGLDPEAPNAIRALGGRGHEVWLLQLLSDVEMDPDLEGDLRLLDGEGGLPIEITANGMVLKEYRKRLQAHNEQLAEAVRRSGGRYELIVGNKPMEKVLKDVLKRQGWLT
ncbi:MAG: DUF58 domain-containing protein [Fimbriimonas sp.]